jgi:hypothetical protein
MYENERAGFFSVVEEERGVHSETAAGYMDHIFIVMQHFAVTRGLLLFKLAEGCSTGPLSHLTKRMARLAVIGSI